jgi:uncharacterized membrane protein
VTRAIEAAGVLVIVLGIVMPSIGFVRSREADRLRNYRSAVGRGILLGLEFLVAADIINTVAMDPTLESLAVLAGIVVIRTFLSFSLEVEIEGRWPWQRHRAGEPGANAEAVGQGHGRSGRAP